MAETKPNVDLLKRTLAHIESHPEEWHQEHYRCGSGMCFAGWAATLAGGLWAVEDVDDDEESGDTDMLVAEPGEAKADEDGNVWAFNRAQRILGLSSDQACVLFGSDNSLDELRGMVRYLCGEAS